MAARRQGIFTGTLTEPRWQGGPLDGRTILIHAEQGLGDTLQFIRYASQVKKLGCRVLFECQRALIPLVQTCAGIDQVIARGDCACHRSTCRRLCSVCRASLERPSRQFPRRSPTSRPIGHAFLSGKSGSPPSREFAWV